MTANNVTRLAGELHQEFCQYWNLIVQTGTAEAASDSKAVIDGGVTTLVPTSTADSLNPAEKKVRDFPGRMECPFKREDVLLHECLPVLLHVSVKHRCFLAGSGEQPAHPGSKQCAP